MTDEEGQFRIGPIRSGGGYKRTVKWVQLFGTRKAEKKGKKRIVTQIPSAIVKVGQVQSKKGFPESE